MDDLTTPSDPRDIITETYEDSDMAYIVDFDKYEEMLYNEMEEDLRDLTAELVFDDEWEPEDEEGF